MNAIADHTDIETRRVQWISEQWDSELLFVDESFQRRFVWQDKHRVRFIETILLGYAAPEIFVWTGPTDPINGKVTYSIVDGQQRIRSIVSFIKNEFSLKSAWLGKESETLNIADKTFDQLEAPLRARIWAYKLHINFIANSIDKSQIKKMFLRLNSTNMALNPQELRHAEFDGKFIEVAEEIANNPAWRQPGKVLFTEPEVRRMRDVQFITSILIYLRRGLHEELSQANINAIYDTYNTQYAEADTDKEDVLALLKSSLEIVGEYPQAIKLIKSKVHLYTLMVSIPRLGLEKGNTSLVRDRYRAFVDSYVTFTEDFDSGSDVDKVAYEYRQLSIEGVQKRQNRSRRVSLLARWLKDGVFKSVLADGYDQEADLSSAEVEIIDGSEEEAGEATVGDQTPAK